ncbi:MAG: CBS domain-containing protein [Planctomycetota bacterium]|jgi:CBS domain-containing protein
MAPAAIDTKSHVVDLSDRSFEAFCDDIAGMLGADVACRRREVGTGTTHDLRQHFKTLAAVHHVQAAGTLDGTFHLFFDQGGLFVLAGGIVMSPEDRILDQVKRGSIDDAEDLTDAVREVGNLLIGSWDRVFREDCEGHERFLKTGTFIGKPWEHTGQQPSAEDDELAFVLYEMAVAPYPSFHCAAVFPRTIISLPISGSKEPNQARNTEEPPPVDPTEPAQQGDASGQAPEAPQAPPVLDAEPSLADWPQPKTQVPAEQGQPPENPAPARDTQDWVQKPTKEEAGDPVEPTQIPSDIRPVVEEVVGDVADLAAEPEADLPDALLAFIAEPERRRPVFTAPDEPSPVYTDPVQADPPAQPSDTGITDMLAAQASDIMRTDVLWCDPDDTVQHVVASMQQHNTGYVLVGSDGVLQGLVSNSNIMAGVSPYLRPVFAKWRRSQDDATLEIKVKWLMSRPVRTVTPDTTLGNMAEAMRRYGGRCLPVVDAQGRVHGIVTVFDILLRVLETGVAFSWKGEPPQAPPLLG